MAGTSQRGLPWGAFLPWGAVADGSDGPRTAFLRDLDSGTLGLLRISEPGTLGARGSSSSVVATHQRMRQRGPVGGAGREERHG